MASVEEKIVVIEKVDLVGKEDGVVEEAGVEAVEVVREEALVDHVVALVSSDWIGNGSLIATVVLTKRKYINKILPIVHLFRDYLKKIIQIVLNGHRRFKYIFFCLFSAFLSLCVLVIFSFWLYLQ